MKRYYWMVLVVAVFAAGMMAGCSDASKAPAQPSAPVADASAAQPQAEVWTCPMHPEVKEAKAGICPKCKMALVKAEPKGK